MKKTLVLLDTFFPFLNGNTFIENEMNFYNVFDEVYIIPEISVGKIRDVKFLPNTKVIKSKKQMYGKEYPLRFLYLIPYELSLFFKTVFWEEIKCIFRKKKSLLVVLKRLKKLFFQMSFAEWYVKFIKEYLRIHQNEETIYFFYSYWLDEKAYTAVLLSELFPGSIAVARAHAGDVYDYEDSKHYNLFRSFLLNNLHCIFSESEDGKKYLEEKFPDMKSPIKIACLGTRDNGCNLEVKLEKPFKIISCQRLRPHKRIERLIESLSLITDVEIEWTHVGEGSSFRDIKQYAEKALHPNIHYLFVGNMSNKELLEFYKNNDFHVFVSVSLAEGIPVSIMEATSFGIPVIATNVGATSEIVIEGYNGFLLEKNFSDRDFCELIKRMVNMNQDDYYEFRSHARQYWIDHYRAENNYKEFVDTILELNA